MQFGDPSYKSAMHTEKITLVNKGYWLAFFFL